MTTMWVMALICAMSKPHFLTDDEAEATYDPPLSTKIAAAKDSINSRQFLAHDTKPPQRVRSNASNLGCPVAAPFPDFLHSMPDPNTDSARQLQRAFGETEASGGEFVSTISLPYASVTNLATLASNCWAASFGTPRASGRGPSPNPTCSHNVHVARSQVDTASYANPAAPQQPTNPPRPSGHDRADPPAQLLSIVNCQLPICKTEPLFLFLPTLGVRDLLARLR